MHNKYPLLFSPLTVGCKVSRNRIQSAPMLSGAFDPGSVDFRENVDYYVRHAKGGAGIVTIGESIIPTTTGVTHEKIVRLGDPKCHRGLALAAEGIHRYGALANIEISHGGAMADPAYNDGNASIGPMGYVDEWGDEIIAMDEKMMNQVADEFAEAAAIVRRLGFDMCMIHCGHGWLLSQFLSPLFNQRTDAYGGSRENRERFPLLVLERVRAKVGRDFVLDMRISGSEFLEGGMEIEDCVSFCAKAQKYVNIINVSAGAPWTKRMATSIYEERGINLSLAAAVKAAVDIPVTAVGGFVDGPHMEGILQEGSCDAFVIARGLVADSQLPNKLFSGKEDVIHRCIKCFECIGAPLTYGERRCTVNPTVGFEREVREKPAELKKVLIAGGGPAGLQAALTASMLGHKVILFEKTDSLGGALKFAAHEDFKHDLWNYAQRQIALLEKSNVEIRLNTELTPMLAASEQADVIIAAVGAEPVVPPIPGVRGGNVIKATELYDEGVTVGKNVVIIGAGLVGCETSIHLAKEGHGVTVVEMLPEAAAECEASHRRYTINEMEAHGVAIMTETACVEIGGESVTVRRDGQLQEVSADTVILAAGMRARTAAAESLRLSAPVFYAIGDCLRAGKVMSATRAAYDIVWAL